MGKTTYMAAFLTLLTSCNGELEEKNNHLNISSCFDVATISDGDIISGRMATIYSPDGPLLVRSSCGNGRIILYFTSQSLENSTVNTMRQRSTGDLHGGQAYLVQFQGVAGPMEQRYGARRVDVSTIVILENIDGAEIQ